MLHLSHAMQMDSRTIHPSLDHTNTKTFFSRKRNILICSKSFSSIRFFIRLTFECPFFNFFCPHRLRLKTKHTHGCTPLQTNTHTNTISLTLSFSFSDTHTHQHTLTHLSLLLASSFLTLSLSRFSLHLKPKFFNNFPQKFKKSQFLPEKEK